MPRWQKLLRKQLQETVLNIQNIDRIMENLEIYPELDDKIIEMMNIAEEEMKAKQTVCETQTKVKKIKGFFKRQQPSRCSFPFF